MSRNARKQLDRARELDQQFRNTFKGLDPDELHILCAVVSVAAWELRGYADKVDELQRSEIIAAFICKLRDIGDYPLAGMK